MQFNACELCAGPTQGGLEAERCKGTIIKGLLASEDAPYMVNTDFWIRVPHRTPLVGPAESKVCRSTTDHRATVHAEKEEEEEAGGVD